MSETALVELVRRMPKVELHLHLEGAIRPGTLLELARRRGISLPADDEEGLREWFRFESFSDFIPVYLDCSQCLRDPEEFQRVVRELMEDQAAQNVVYTEAYLTPSTHRSHGVNVDEMRQAVWEAAVEGERRLGVRLRIVPDIVRNVGPKEGERTLQWALEGREEGVVALGISGSEDRYPVEPFAFHFRTAREEGLPRLAHAGEQVGPEGIRSVLATCDPARIGHGVRAVEDPALVEELASRGIPLELCPSSNVALGVVASWEEHPFDELKRAGVRVGVHSDDPLFFDTDLTRELLGLHRTFGYDEGTLADLSREALAQSLLPGEDRRRWADDIDRQLAALGEELLGEPLRATGSMEKGR